MNWFSILKTIPYEWLMKIDGRPILLADLGNEKVLFYKRTGDGGEPRKGQPDAGMFAPFFGFSYLNRYVYWFIKGYPERYDKYEKEAKELDKIVKETPTDLPSMSLFSANKLFRNRGATLGRPEYDKMGYKVFYDWPTVMVVVGKRVKFKVGVNLRAIEWEYEYFKDNNQYPELVEAYESIKKKIGDLDKRIPLTGIKYSGDILQPKKKQKILENLRKINGLREELKIEYEKFLKVWEDWKDELNEIDFSPLEYKEMSIPEANSRKDVL